MKFTVADLRLFKNMVAYANGDDVKELSKGLHDTQPYFCQILQTIAYDPRCVEVYRFCLLFCSIASEHAERVLQIRDEEYVTIPKEYFDTMAHMIAQKNLSIGKRGRSYPDRIQKYVLSPCHFDPDDTEWLLIMIPSFLYTLENFFGKKDPENFFVSLYNEL